MRRRRAREAGCGGLLCLVGFLVLAPGALAGAHPLGNFTVNHAVGVDLAPTGVRVDYVLDLAELPTVTERDAVTSAGPGAYGDRRCAELAAGLSLEVDGEAPRLAVRQASAALLAGQGGLETLRVECRFEAPLALPEGHHRLVIVDGNEPDRIGWRELSARGFGTQLATDLPEQSPTGRLTSYDPAAVPLRVEGAELDLTVTDVGARLPGVGSPTAPGTGDAGTGDAGTGNAVTGDTVTGDAMTAGVTGDGVSNDQRADDPLTRLIAQGDRGLWAAVIALAVAAGLGAMHGLAPGHGKTVVAAYLVGTGGSRRQAAGLALAVALSHTLGVFLLGGLTLVASAAFPLERVYGWLQLSSALIILGLGAWLGLGLLRARRSPAPARTMPQTLGAAVGAPALVGVGSPRDGHGGTYVHPRLHDHADADHDPGAHSHDHGHFHDTGHSHGHTDTHGHDDGHSHDAGHEHDHTGHGHTHTHGHDDRHSHDAGHEHDHTGHGHTHTHGHDDRHSHDAGREHDHTAHGHAHDHDHAPGHIHDLDHDRSGQAHVGHAGRDHAYSHADHGHGHAHSHGLLPHRHRSWDTVDLSARLGWRQLAALGLSGGMVPSASAVIVLLGAVQLGRVAFGAGLILAFGFGLAAALVGVGLGLVVLARRAQHVLDARQLGQRVAATVAPVAAVLLVAIGTWLAWRAFGRLA